MAQASASNGIIGTMSGYTITEEDIEKTLNYLRIFHPENANREFAEEFLKYWKAAYRRIGAIDPDALDELYDAFTKKKYSDVNIDSEN
jgi:hypothetical protein